MKANARYIWTVCLVATMGGLPFGYDWVVVGGANQFYEEFFGLKTRCKSAGRLVVPWSAAWWDRSSPGRQAISSGANGC